MMIEIKYYNILDKFPETKRDKNGEYIIPKRDDKI